MNNTIKLRTLTALMLALLVLLCACGNAAAPAASAEPTDAAPTDAVPTDKVQSDAAADGRVHVSTVDELLAAIAPGSSIYLEKGEYDLTEASDYGGEGSEYYRWNEVYEGYELEISGVSDLSITAGLNDEKLPQTSIVTKPRMANVLRFENCEDISVFGVVVGHTEAPGVCSGGVLALTNVDEAVFEYCELYGCGTLALDAVGCEEITVQNSVIRHCTVGAVSAERSRAVVIKLCEVYDCGDYRLFTFDGSKDCAVMNCSIFDNNANILLDCGYSENINLLGCTVKDNNFSEPVFCIDRMGEAPVIAGCEFVQNALPAWFGDAYMEGEAIHAVGQDGQTLTDADMESMTCQYIEWTPPEDDDPVQAPGGEVKVSTVDELLAAIAPDTTVILEPGEYDLTEASDYGSFGKRYYYWEDSGDGAALTISDADGLTLKAAEAGKVTISTRPRYAQVLSFDDCDKLYLSGLTVGHTEEPGVCSGGVLLLIDCEEPLIEACSLYGCGTIGIEGYDCEELRAVDTEIYDCSRGAVLLTGCDDAAFTGCNIHDMPADTFEYSVSNSKNVTVDGKNVN